MNEIRNCNLRQNTPAEQLPFEQDIIVHRARLLDIELETKNDRLGAFHIKRRHLLNHINVLIPLMSRETYLWTATGTEKDSAPMVLSKNSLTCFQHQARIARDGLENERLAVKSLRAEKKRLESEQKVLEQSVVTMHAKCTEIQLLRFGRKLDIETFRGILQYACDDNASKLRRPSDSSKKVMHDMEKKSLVESIELSKMELMSVTKENTQILNEIVELMETVDTAQTKKRSLSRGAKQDSDFDRAQRSSLLKRDIIGATGQIDNLRSEIRRLKRNDAWAIRA